MEKEGIMGGRRKQEGRQTVNDSIIAPGIPDCTCLLLLLLLTTMTATQTTLYGVFPLCALPSLALICLLPS